MSAEQAPALAAGEFAETSTSFRRLLRLSLRAHSVFAFLAVVYLIADQVVTTAYGIPSEVSVLLLPIAFVISALPVFLLSVVVLRACRIILHERPKHPVPALWQDLKAFLGSPRRLANGLPAAAFLFVFMCTFSSFKTGIPTYNPFSWDETFVALDRALHFGADPWVLLQPLLGFPVVTFVINFLYNLWFMVMWIIWMWLGFSTSHSALRMQFFLSFSMCWLVGGTILATVFSSAGPCYYAAVVGGADPFAPLMAYLRDTNEIFPLFALETQAALWDGYLGNQSLVAGISAMPSMHNATAVLFALVGWRTSRTLGIILTVYAVAILLGSVHLGWHYAVDGYFGALIALAIWWCSGRFIAWYEQRAHVREYAVALKEA